MSKISDLTKAINDSTAKELQNIEQQAPAVIKQTWQNMQDSLKNAQNIMQADLKELQASNSKALSETATELKKQHAKILADSQAQLEALAQQMIQPLEQIQQNSNEKALTIAKNRWLWVILGLVGALVLVLMIWSMILAKNITAQHAELTNIKQAVNQSPIQAQALAKVQIGKNDDGTIWIEPKNHKKSELGKSTDGKPLMLLK